MKNNGQTPLMMESRESWHFPWETSPMKCTPLDILQGKDV